jgi:hypothetical protein
MKLRPREVVVLALVDSGHLRDEELYDGAVALWIATNSTLRVLPARLRALLQVDAPARAPRTGSSRP